MKQSKKEWSSVSPSSKSDSAHSRRSHSEDIFSPIKIWTFRDAQWRTHPAARFTLSMPCTHGDTTSPKPTSLLHGIFWTPLTPQVPRGSSFFASMCSHWTQRDTRGSFFYYSWKDGARCLHESRWREACVTWPPGAWKLQEAACLHWGEHAHTPGLTLLMC